MSFFIRSISKFALSFFLCKLPKVVFKPSREIPTDLLSVFDPYGNAVHTALSFNMVGEDVLITGAGPIGIMAAAVCKHAGARCVVITDRNDYRLKLAEKMGATRAVNVLNENLDDVKKELKIREGFDIALEMSGVPSGWIKSVKDNVIYCSSHPDCYVFSGKSFEDILLSLIHI